jgi:hypothetical protein
VSFLFSNSSRGSSVCINLTVCILRGRLGPLNVFMAGLSRSMKSSGHALQLSVLLHKQGRKAMPPLTHDWVLGL